MKKSKMPTTFTIVRKRGYEVDRQKRNWKGTWKEALTDLWSYVDCIFYTIFVYKEKWECNQLDLLQSTFQYSQTSLSPSIHIQILPNWSPYISLRISWENNLIIEQGIFSWVIILFILLTYLSTVYRYQ